jgi:hypothetical protein
MDILALLKKVKDVSNTLKYFQDSELLEYTKDQVVKLSDSDSESDEQICENIQNLK